MTAIDSELTSPPDDGEGGQLPVTGFPLVTRLLAAFTVVLAISFVVTFLVESNLSRAAVREQAADVLESRTTQVRQSLTQSLDPVNLELLFLESQLPRGLTDDAAARRRLVRLLEDIAGRQTFGLIGAYTMDGPAVAPITGPSLATPPAEVFEEDFRTRYTRRVVPLADGGFGYVNATLLGAGDERILVAFGYVVDRALARTLRDAAGGSEVVLVVDDEVLASSVPGTSGQQLLPSGRRDSGVPVVEVGDTTYWSRYEVFAQGEGVWGSVGDFGVLVEEPLKRLDAQLLRNRLGAGAALLFLATLMAWVVSRRMTRPLRDLTATASRISDGDLDAQFEVSTSDEVGTLAAALENMRSGLGRQVALIERQAAALQLAARRTLGAQDEARRQLAGDLHDGVQRQLVMLRLHIGFGRETIRQEPERADEVLDDLAEQVDRVLSRLRDTAQGIYPAILRDRGLTGALHSLVTRTRLPITVSVDPDPLPRLSHDVEANTYFLASEAVTNAVKHADASRIEVSVRLREAVMTVRVADDGQGFDPQRIEDGRGLANLRDRAGALAGRVQVTTGPGGTTVLAILPASPSTALQVEQDGSHSAVQFEILAQAELAEDGADVLLDRTLRDVEFTGDGTIPLPGGHGAEDVEFSRGQPRKP